VYKAVAYLCKMEPMAKFRYATISIILILDIDNFYEDKL